VRLLAAAGSQRYPTLPDVPTVAESGLPGYALDVWMGLTMPAKVAPAIVSRLNAAVASVLNAPEVKAKLAPQGIDVLTGSPQDMAKLVREEHARWGKIIRAAGIKAD
jgi:tripartite-type tricarboxylate transporter receptor subunit TctC